MPFRPFKPSRKKVYRGLPSFYSVNVKPFPKFFSSRAQTLLFSPPGREVWPLLLFSYGLLTSLYEHTWLVGSRDSFRVPVSKLAEWVPAGGGAELTFFCLLNEPTNQPTKLVFELFADDSFLFCFNNEGFFLPRD